MRKRILLFWTISLAIISLACSPCQLEKRDPGWAEPNSLEMVFNLYKVSDDLYRSACPGSEIAMENIEKELRVKTIITLERFHDDYFISGGRKLKLIHIPIDTDDPKDSDVIRVMKVFKKSEDGPFLIHCFYGSDRTGLMVAMYRIIYQNWEPGKAIAELKCGGYGFHPAKGRKIVEYLQNLNNEKIAEIKTAIDFKYLLIN